MMLLPQAPLPLPPQNPPPEQVLPARLRQRNQLKSNKKPLILTSVSMSRKLLGFYQKIQAPSTTLAFQSNLLFVMWERMNMGLLSTPVPIRSVAIPPTLGIFLAVGAMSGAFI